VAERHVRARVEAAAELLGEEVGDGARRRDEDAGAAAGEPRDEADGREVEEQEGVIRPEPVLEQREQQDGGQADGDDEGGGASAEAFEQQHRVFLRRSGGARGHV
jgi:hypothetical protein